MAGGRFSLYDDDDDTGSTPFVPGGFQSIVSGSREPGPIVTQPNEENRRSLVEDSHSTIQFLASSPLNQSIPSESDTGTLDVPQSNLTEDHAEPPVDRIISEDDSRLGADVPHTNTVLDPLNITGFGAVSAPISIIPEEPEEAEEPPTETRPHSTIEFPVLNSPSTSTPQEPAIVGDPGVSNVGSKIPVDSATTRIDGQDRLDDHLQITTPALTITPDGDSQQGAIMTSPVSVIQEEPEEDADDAIVAKAPVQIAIKAADTAATAFFETGDIEQANTAIANLKELLHSTGETSAPELPKAQQAVVAEKLSIVLSHRFEHFGDVDDIEQAVEFQMKLAEIAFEHGSDPNLKAKSLTGLGRTLAAQFEHTGDPTDAELAVDNMTRALEAIPEGDPARPVLLGDFAKVNLARYAHSDDPTHLEQALNDSRKALNTLPHDSPERASLSNLVGKALLAQCERSLDDDTIEEAVQLLGQAVESTPVKSPERPKRMRNHGDALLARFRSQRNESDLESAIQVQKDALELLDPENVSYPEVTGSLAAAFRVRYKDLGGKLEDLDNAIENFKTTVELTPFTSPDHPRITDLLGKSFVSKYRYERKLEYLDYAVMLHKQAVALTPPDSRHYASRLENLGYAYSKRYRTYPRHRRPSIDADKPEAERTLREAMSINPDRATTIQHEINKLNQRPGSE